MAYKLTPVDPNSDLQYVIRLADGARIPNFEDNEDYVEYQKWLAGNNVPEPADAVAEA